MVMKQLDKLRYFFEKYGFRVCSRLAETFVNQYQNYIIGAILSVLIAFSQRGALVNINGDLIGINTAIQSTNAGFIGYSFAVPSNIARKIYEDILELGDVQRGL